ncbi:MAG: hypothetical protein QOK23_4819 [Gammaproteobacteria bacterium]|jgi:hypothetical protein|nr:hypothetical protein [Gammaproteobacteria bacterium]
MDQASASESSEQSNSQVFNYCNGGFLQVGGWGIDRNLINAILLIQQFQKGHRVAGPLVEIGVHEGRVLILFALLQAGDELAVGVDLFEGAQDQNIDKSGYGSYNMTEHNFQRHAPSANYVLFAENSLALSGAAVEAMKGARLFHIDGGHTLEVALNDIAVAMSYLGVGGVIIIDDYWHPGWPEVQEAVHRYYATSTDLKAVPFMTGMNKLFLAHVSHKDRLLNFLIERLPEGRNKPVRLFGHSAICCEQSLPSATEWIIQPEID